MISKIINALKTLQRGERGITGLETAIILIAFVVVASVFAYTVLSAGMFSSQSAQESVYTGLEEARSPLSISGSVVGKSSDGAQLTSLVFTVENALNGIGIDMTGSASDNVVVFTYHSATNVQDDVTFTASQVAWGDNDAILEAGEKFEVTVTMTGTGDTIDEYDSWCLDMKPPRGSVLKICRVMPQSIDSVMILQ